MISTGIEILAVAGALVGAAIACLLIGWHLGRRSLLEGFRMGRISQDKPDIVLAKPGRKEITRLGDEYDPFDEAMKDPANKSIGTMEGERT